MPASVVETLLVVLAYLLGSIPAGLILTRLFSSVDIRSQGSGNVGATNVARVAGSALGLATLATDVLKGLLPVLLAHLYGRGGRPPGEILLAAVALAAVVGHMYPVYTRFKGGGKGVATTAGAFLALSTWSVLITLAVFGAVMGRIRIVSAASLAAVAALPPALWLITRSATFLLAGLAAAALVALRHRDNIGRLVARSEPEFKIKRDSR